VQCATTTSTTRATTAATINNSKHAMIAATSAAQSRPKRAPLCVAAQRERASEKERERYIDSKTALSHTVSSSLFLTSSLSYCALVDVCPANEKQLQQL